MALAALSPMPALHPMPSSPPLASLSGREQPLLSSQPLGEPSPSQPLLWALWQLSHLSMQERIVKVMDDYQVMDEFLYNLSTEDFNDK
ncbi:hypothetical protein MC885_021330 [Smutsia gigantea]|nr:hypothetical protein MC885_021330 [Smutsia gigantea]